MKKLCCPALLFLLAASTSAAEPEKLREKADDLHREWVDERTDAEERARESGLVVRPESPDGGDVELQRFLGDKPLYLATDNLNAADTISTDEVWAGGDAGLSLTGAGLTLGIWDGGLSRATHQELTGRVTGVDAAGISNHATHVGGTMIATGVESSARGMANGALLRSRDFNDDESEMMSEQALPDPIPISNHSYGFITGWRFGNFGCADLTGNRWYWFGDVSVSTEEDLVFGLYITSAWDDIAHDAPGYLQVKSAGNDRGEGPSGTVSHCHWDSTAGKEGEFVGASDDHPVDGGATGYDTLGGGSASAKNTLTVGAVSDISGGYTGPSDVVMSSFSGWGPTDDGRIKPDVVANGISLFSASSSSDAGYTSLSGTSMSTPNASGSLALLQQLAEELGSARGTEPTRLRGSTLKALAIGTADEAGPDPGPDYMFGWGLLNIRRAAELLVEDSARVDEESTVHEGELADLETDTFFVHSDGSEPLKITLVWHDPPGVDEDGSTLDPATVQLVNDLDLEVFAGRSTYLPWVLDPGNPSAAATVGINTVDNVEQVWIENTFAGTYQVNVRHQGSISDGPQQYGLVIVGSIGPTILTDGFESGDTTAWSNGG